MVSENDILLIEKYLDRTLSTEEEKAFLNRLTYNPELQSALSKAQQQHSWLHTMAVGNQLAEVHQAYVQGSLADKAKSTPSQKLSKPTIWLIITLIILSLGVLAWIFWLSKENIPHQPIALEMSINNTNLLKARRAFNQGEYAKALPLITTHLEQQGITAEWLLAKGVCQLELSDLEAAHNSFQNLLDLGTTNASTANFYLGVVSFRQGDFSAAKTYLQAVDPSDYYYSLAMNFLSKI